MIYRDIEFGAINFRNENVPSDETVTFNDTFLTVFVNVNWHIDGHFSNFCTVDNTV